MNSVLRDVRRRAGYTCEQVSSFLGVAPSVVSRYESGVIETDRKTIKGLSAVYNMEPWQLLKVLEDPQARSALWDYSAGDIGIYQECASCGTPLLLPPGEFRCPSCGKDSLLTIDVGNGLGGIASLEAVLRADDTPDVSYPGNPNSLKPVSGGRDGRSMLIELLADEACTPSRSEGR